MQLVGTTMLAIAERLVQAIDENLPLQIAFATVPEGISADFPSLSPQDFKAAIAFAAPVSLLRLRAARHSYIYTGPRDRPFGGRHRYDATLERIAGGHARRLPVGRRVSPGAACMLLDGLRPAIMGLVLGMLASAGITRLIHPADELPGANHRH
jgi:hypothetical protein